MDKNMDIEHTLTSKPIAQPTGYTRARLRSIGIVGNKMCRLKWLLELVYF